MSRYRVQVIDERYRDTKHQSSWYTEAGAKHQFFRMKQMWSDHRVQMICNANSRVMLDTKKEKAHV
jgi:hypothetical protein